MNDTEYLRQILSIEPKLTQDILYLNLDDLYLVISNNSNNKYINCILYDYYFYFSDNDYFFYKLNSFSLTGNSTTCYLNKMYGDISYIENNNHITLQYDNKEIFEKDEQNNFIFLQQIIYFNNYFIIDQTKHELRIVYNDNKLIMRSETKDKKFKIYLNYKIVDNICKFYLLEIHKQLNNKDRYVILIHDSNIAIAIIHQNIIKYCNGIYYNKLDFYFELFNEFDTLDNILLILEKDYVKYWSIL